MLDAVLLGLLKPEHKKAGLFLSEEDDHTVSLFKTLNGQNRRLAVFNANTTITAIQEVADKHINEPPPEKLIVFNSFGEFEVAAENYCREHGWQLEGRG